MAVCSEYITSYEAKQLVSAFQHENGQFQSDKNWEMKWDIKHFLFLLIENEHSAYTAWRIVRCKVMTIKQASQTHELLS